MSLRSCLLGDNDGESNAMDGSTVSMSVSVSDEPPSGVVTLGFFGVRRDLGLDRLRFFEG